MAARGLRDGSATVGQIIREYRKARGVTQKQFAGEPGFEARTLRAIFRERGSPGRHIWARS